MADTYVPPGEMAAEADSLAGAALAASNARDWMLQAWQLDWACPDELKEAYDQFCTTWLAGCDSMGQYTQFLAEYTQSIANAYCAVDQKLADGYNPLHDKGSMPKHYYDPPPPGSTGPVA